jgi:protein XagA
VRCVRVALGYILGLGTLFSSIEARAGAWTLDADHGQILLTGAMSGGIEAFDGSRKLKATPRYNKFEFQGLFEYGVTDRLTAILAPGLQHIDIAAPLDARRTGLGFSEFGARYKFLQGEDWMLSGQSAIRVPGTFEAGNPAAVGYNHLEFDFRALLGRAFLIYNLPAFVDLQLGQRFRAGDQSNELRIDATVGVRPLQQWLLLVQLLNVISEGAKPPLFPSYDYSKLQVSLVHDLTRQWSLQGGGFTTYSGRHALQENGLIVGAWYRW